MIHNVERITEIRIGKGSKNLSGECLQMEQLPSAASILLILGINVRIDLKKTEERVEQTMTIGLGAANGLNEHLVEDAFYLAGTGSLFLCDGGDGFVRVSLALKVESLLTPHFDPLPERIRTFLSLGNKKLQCLGSDIRRTDITLQGQEKWDSLDRIDQSLAKQVADQIQTAGTDPHVGTHQHLVEALGVLRHDAADERSVLILIARNSLAHGNILPGLHLLLCLT